MGAGLAADLGIGAVLWLFGLPNASSLLRDYWAAFYLDGSPSDMVGQVWARLTATALPEIGWEWM